MTSAEHFESRETPDANSPPTIVVDGERVTAWLGGQAEYTMLWSQIEQVSAVVIVEPELDYSEAFWELEGEGAYFGAPIDLAANASILTERLLAMKGFDT